MLIQKPQYTASDVKILEQSTPFQGYFQIQQLRLQFRCFAGGWSQPITREVFERGSAAAVLPYDPTQRQVILIEQFRVGALLDEYSPWLIEVIAGIIDPDDRDPQQTVSREAQEEAGLQLKQLQSICSYWVSPGGTSERCHLFYAEIDANQAQGIHGYLPEDEDIRVVVVDVDAAFAAITSGRINNASTIIALQWLQLKLQKEI